MFYFPSGQEGTPVPVWEVAQCRIEDQAPVVTWEITLETHLLRFSHSTAAVLG